MRILMWFTLGFAAASAVCAYAWITQGILPVVLWFALLFAALMIISIRLKWLRLPAAVCLGIAAGLGWFQLYSDFYLSQTSAVNGHVCDVTARCTDYSYRTDYGSAVEGYIYLESKPYRAKFYVKGDIEMEPGDILTGAFELRVTTPEGNFGSSSYQGDGIFLVGYQREDAELAKLSDTPIWAFPAILRRNLGNLLDSCFSEDAAPFAKALLLGDRQDIDYETETAFKVSGIMHIIAVSGMHVTILFSLVYALCFKRRTLVAMIGIPVLVLFAFVGGLSASIVRACIMQCLMILAMLFDREYDGPTELSFACLAMMAANPLVITSVAFQLSVGCMIGIFLFQKTLYEGICARLGCEKKHRFVKLKRWFASSVSMTFSAMSLTTPLVAWYFGTVSLVGVLTNLLTLWIISFIFYSCILVCLTGWILPSAGAFLAQIAAWPIRYVLTVSRLLAAFPLAAVYTRSVYIVIWLVFCYVLLIIFAVSRKKKIGLLAACASIGLVLSLGASWLEHRTDNCRMTVLDVGQGQCIILQSEGKTYLVDCGGSYDEGTADLAARTLLSQGVFRLDGVILTHFDRDHAGAAEMLLARIPADMIFVPDCADEGGVALALEESLPGAVNRVSQDLILTYGATEITIFAPVMPDSGNESSLAVLFRKQNCDILITGDRSGFGERMLLKTASIPDLDILVAGHHGAKDATCEELLNATMPEIVVISVGENSYGHPSREVLDRLEQFGCTVYRTDIMGEIIIRR